MALCDECREISRVLCLANMDSIESVKVDKVDSVELHPGIDEHKKSSSQDDESWLAYSNFTRGKMLHTDCPLCRILGRDMEMHYAKCVNGSVDWRQYFDTWPPHADNPLALIFRLVKMDKRWHCGGALDFVGRQSARNVMVLESCWLQHAWPGRVILERGWMWNCFVPKREETAHVRVLDPKADLNIVRCWYDFCCANHVTLPKSLCGSACQPKISGFKVIDCVTRRVVEHLSGPYLALSYVWGSDLQSNQDDTGEYQLPDVVPRTIEDAIAVTLELEFSYLWVDRYCIDQRNQIEVYEQVSRMDIIYEQSEFTIVAAAGTDSFYGLPGISTPRTHGECEVVINDMPFRCLPLDPKIEIGSSKWASRGWTYQEALISRRLLVFTETEVYFECGEMTCRESVEPEWKLGSPSGPPHSHHGILKESLGSAIYRISQHSKEVLFHIERYRLRKFTKDSDILEGFRGILASFESRFGIEHCWGVPIFPDVPETLLSDQDDMHWNSSKSFMAGMIATCGGTDRRFGFPSWSWTGWRSDSTTTILDARPVFENNLQVLIELKDGRKMPWGSFAKLFSSTQRHRELSQFIHIKVWQYSIKIREVKVSSTGAYYDEDTNNEKGWFISFKINSAKAPLGRLRFWPLAKSHKSQIQMVHCSKSLSGNGKPDKGSVKMLFPYSLENHESWDWHRTPSWVVMQTTGGWYEKIGEVQPSNWTTFRDNFSKFDHSLEWIRLG